MYLPENIHKLMTKAIKKGDTDKLQNLIRDHGLPSTIGFDLLCDVIRHYETKSAEILLSHNCRVNNPSQLTDSPLHLAIERGNVALVKLLLNKGAAIDVLDKRGCTPLILAIRREQNPIAKLLLNRGASIDICCGNNLSPLHEAAKTNVELVATLIKYGVAVDRKCAQNFTPLHIAAQYKDGNKWRNDSLAVVKFLIKSGASLDAQNFEDQTPLHLSFQNDDKKVAQLLIESTTLLERQNKFGETALHLAVKNDYFDAAKLLLDKGARVNAMTKENATPLYLAAVEGNENIFELLLQYGAQAWSNILVKNNIHTILNLLLSKGCPLIVKYILKHFEIVAEDFYDLLKQAVLNSNETARIFIKHFVDRGFHFCAQVINDMNFIAAVIENGYLDIFEDLLKFGLNVNMIVEKDESNRLPLLHIAVANEQTKIIEFLADKAKINTLDNSEKSALMVAVEKACDTDSVDGFEVVKLLVDKTVDVNLADDRGLTPLLVAIMKGNFEIVKFLYQHGAQINAKTKKGDSALHLVSDIDIAKFLIEKDAEVDCKNADGVTPFLMAVREDELEIVELLLQKNVNIYWKDKDSDSALHAVRSPAMLQLLLKKGACVFCENKKELSPLHHVILLRDVQMLELLLDCDPYLDARDEKGLSPFLYAIQEVQKDLVEPLLDSGCNIFACGYEGNNVFDYLDESSYYIGFEEMAKTFQHHCVQRWAAGLEYCLAFFSVPTNLVSPGFQDRCELEIASMKKDNVGDSSFSFYNILQGSLNRLTALTRNKNFLSYVQSDALKDKYPIYKGMISRRLKEAERRRHLLDEFQFILHTIFPFLPQPCIAEIIGFFSNLELKLSLHPCNHEQS